jgi:hypothetical protein
LPVKRKLVQVLREALQRAALFLRLGFSLGGLFLAAATLRRLGDAVRDEIHHVEARNVLPLEEKHGVRILFSENRDQDVGAGDFLLSRMTAHGGSRAGSRAGSQVGCVSISSLPATSRRVLVDKGQQFLAQTLDVRGACTQGLLPPTDCRVAQAAECSTVMNSWRFCRASTNAMCKLTSSSWAIISLPPSRKPADAGADANIR